MTNLIVKRQWIMTDTEFENFKAAFYNWINEKGMSTQCKMRSSILNDFGKEFDLDKMTVTLFGQRHLHSDTYSARW